MNASTPFEDAESRRFRVAPGLAVAMLFLLLVLAIVVAVIVRHDAGGQDAGVVTIAELRADPDRWDNRSVELEGSAESVRTLPYLDQYAVYTFRDASGSMLALTQKGTPPEGADNRVRLRAVFHARVTLDDELRALVEEQFGPLAGQIVRLLLPGVPLNVVFLEHERYETLGP